MPPPAISGRVRAAAACRRQPACIPCGGHPCPNVSDGILPSLSAAIAAESPGGHPERIQRGGHPCPWCGGILPPKCKSLAINLPK